MKQKRFTHDDLRAISEKVAAENSTERQAEVWVEQIEKKLGSGNFKVDHYGQLRLRFWSISRPNDQLIAEIVSKMKTYRAVKLDYTHTFYNEWVIVP